MTEESFTRITDYYIKGLGAYTSQQLCSKPSPNSWSVGQMYMHLIADTNFYMEQIKICLSDNENASKEASAKAKTMLHNNDFPDEIIDGSPDNAFIPQPETIEQLKAALTNLKAEIHTLALKASESRYCGKAKHPGLSYLSANEWIQLAEMHFRHHLRQKKRIDDYLRSKEA